MSSPAEVVASLRKVTIDGRIITVNQLLVMLLFYELGELTITEVGAIGHFQKPKQVVDKLHAEGIIRCTTKYEHGVGYMLSAEYRVKLNEIYGV